MTRIYLPASVFIGGACVLALEVLGTRVIGPMYGVSVYLWSALIAVTLLALAGGYFVGGRIADRRPRFPPYGLLFLSAGVWTLAIGWMAHPVLDAVWPLGLRPAVLVAALILFGPPLVALGMSTPFALRLAQPGAERVGSVAGRLYALSTVGSVLGALATGFFLVPFYGVRALLFGVGALLVALALPALAGAKRGSTGAIAVAALACAAAALGWAPRERADPAHGLLSVRESPYAELRVVDWNGMRHLVIDGGIHSMIDTGDGTTYFRYVAAMELGKLFYDRPGRVLVIGLGGGSIPKSYRSDGWDVDAVEIDAAVVATARRWFDFTDADARVSVDDGRHFLRKTHRKYDLAILDAFGSSAIPFQLVTVEFFSLLKAHLLRGGIVAVNTESRGWRGPIVRGLAATLRTQFRYVFALPTMEPPDQTGNVILLASDDPLAFPENRLANPGDVQYDNFLHWKTVQMNHAWANRFVPDFARGLVLTDDRNPIDVWTEDVKIEDRRLVAEHFGSGHLNW